MRDTPGLDALLRAAAEAEAARAPTLAELNADMTRLLRELERAQGRH